ncbi:hypothetical protein LTS18_011877, partial [Coniosporium uncinatum]
MPPARRFDWVGAAGFNETLTAATVLQIVNTKLNTTRTSTIYNYPSGFNIPATNSAGTVTTVITRTYGPSSSFVTTLAFPTAFQDYDADYETRVCTNLLSSAFLPSHPPTTQSAATIPVITYEVGNGTSYLTDSQGIYYKPTQYVNGMPYEFYSKVFSDFRTEEWCDGLVPAPAFAVPTALLLTATSVSMEDDDEPTTTSAPVPETTQAPNVKPSGIEGGNSPPPSQAASPSRPTAAPVLSSSFPFPSPSPSSSFSPSPSEQSSLGSSVLPPSELDSAASASEQQPASTTIVPSQQQSSPSTTRTVPPAVSLISGSTRTLTAPIASTASSSNADAGTTSSAAMGG